MKLLNTSLLHSVIVIWALLASPIEATAATSTTGSNQSSDSSWPREKYQNGTRLIVYQPQVDDWKNFQDLSWRMAISLTPKNGKTVIGVVEMKGNTSIDNVSKLVLISNPQVTGTYFPSLDQATKEKMDQLFKSFVPSTLEVSLYHLIASTPKKEAPAGVQLNDEPPKIFVGYRPSILLSVNGEPVLSQVPNTNLKFVVNTQWPLFLDEGNSTYYLAVGQQWLTANKLECQWSATKKLPPDFSKIPQDKQWSALKKFIPPSAKSGAVTQDIFYSDKPAAVPGPEEAKDAVLLAQVPTTMTVNAKEAASKIKVDYAGDPKFEPINGTSMEYATNTQDKVIKVGDVYYLCLQGVWFMSPNPTGP
jgi:hypothetical protein